MNEYNLLGVKLNTLAEHKLKNKLFEFLDSQKQHQIATVNPEFIVQSQNNKKFLEIINKASISLIDGAGIIKALQYLGHSISLDDRITGVRLSEILIDLAINKNLKIMFCLYSKGMTKTDNFFVAIKNKYPALDFQVSDEHTALAKGKMFAPDIILVGLGAPTQDIWISENIQQIPNVKIAAGIGGTFDFMSGKIKRAPKLLQSLGLEWLWRLILQPKRLLRINRAIFIFPYLVYKKAKKQQKHGKSEN
ncbi:MAG: WecB/TagA/CpsF family glycosyltransferase [Patescibacteria group bacterium]|jgi:N-acetylglucosaminyldiphosphoundecaprenol N-acetyl-beta-D-mannosaminyltransferase